VGATEEQSCATGMNGKQNDNGCGVIKVLGPGPSGLVPSRARVGAVYVYSLSRLRSVLLHENGETSQGVRTRGASEVRKERTD
jgi:hypothetical protein